MLLFFFCVCHACLFVFWVVAFRTCVYDYFFARSVFRSNCVKQKLVWGTNCGLHVQECSKAKLSRVPKLPNINFFDFSPDGRAWSKNWPSSKNLPISKNLPVSKNLPIHELAHEQETAHELTCPLIHVTAIMPNSIWSLGISKPAH